MWWDPVSQPPTIGRGADTEEQRPGADIVREPRDDLFQENLLGLLEKAPLFSRRGVNQLGEDCLDLVPATGTGSQSRLDLLTGLLQAPSESALGQAYELAASACHLPGRSARFENQIIGEPTTQR